LAQPSEQQEQEQQEQEEVQPKRKEPDTQEEQDTQDNHPKRTRQLGQDTPSCRLVCGDMPFQVQPFPAGYDAYTPSFTAPGGFIAYPESYCGEVPNPPGTSHRHAAEAYSSDGLDLAGCRAKCDELQCTCFDYSNHTAPHDSCTAADFSVNLNGLRCYGLQASYDTMTTPEACAEACCAMGSGCEVWQFTTDPSDFDGSCWVGKIDPASCESDPTWIGGGRPGANQIFSVVGAGKGSSNVIRSQQYVAEAGGKAGLPQQLCFHAKTTSPVPQEIPNKTPVGLESCDQNFAQQFVYDESDGTIRLSADPVACFNQLSKMHHCFDDPTAYQSGTKNWQSALMGQSWNYDASTKQIRLVYAAALSCSSENNIMYYANDIPSPVGHIGIGVLSYEGDVLTMHCTALTMHCTVCSPTKSAATCATRTRFAKRSRTNR
jgi:hypothetical protein